jgi:hypothetical protein
MITTYRVSKTDIEDAKRREKKVPTKQFGNYFKRTFLRTVPKGPQCYDVMLQKKM